jgi:hypothetical protein
MGGGGQNRLPDNVKQLRGSLRPSRVGEASRLPTSPVPSPPRSLSALEKRVWRELAPVVDAARTHTVADTPAFRLLVEAVAYSKQDMAPSAKVRVLSVCTSLLAGFGLTPGSRGRVPAAPKPPPPSPLDEFLRKS